MKYKALKLTTMFVVFGIASCGKVDNASESKNTSSHKFDTDISQANEDNGQNLNVERTTIPNKFAVVAGLTYIHKKYETSEECDAAVEKYGQWAQCSESVSFATDGFVSLTEQVDIRVIYEYTQTNEEIVVHEEIGDGIRYKFIISEDGKTLTDESGNKFLQQ